MCVYSLTSWTFAWVAANNAANAIFIFMCGYKLNGLGNGVG